MKLPPFLLVKAMANPNSRGTISLSGTSGESADRATLAFGDALSVSRAARGFHDDLTLNSNGVRPEAVAGKIWIPHVFCFDDPTLQMLIWERCPASEFEEKLSAPLVDGERWANQPQPLLRLLSIASLEGRFVEAPTAQTHLSFRWILAHQQDAAMVASEGTVAIDHVSLHVNAEAEEATIELLVGALGLIEIPRPAEITIPGRWLQAGRTRIHLNSRSADPVQTDFPGPQPNHICFGISELDAAESAVRAAGVPTRRAGSLGEQVWFRLAGVTIELQPLRP